MSVANSLLLFVVLGIFLFCYFIATRVWIRVDEKNRESSPDSEKNSIRDFLYLSSMSIGGIGVVTFMWPFVKSMSPAEDTLALGSTEVNLSDILIGQSITVKWRGKPVFIRRRTEEEILEAKNVDLNILKDPISDDERVKKASQLLIKYLVKK